MKNKLFFLDAETDGLYGKIISIAVVVTDVQGNEIERFYYGINKEKLVVQDTWVKENVVPKLGDYEAYDNEETLLEAFWSKWIQYADEAYAVADVIYPVEMRVFEKCVMFDETNRKWSAPFPFIDLSSMIYAKGLDPDTSRTDLSEMSINNNQHNALFDVEMSIAIYKKLMN